MILEFSNISVFLGWEGVNTWHVFGEVRTGPAYGVRANIRLIVAAAKLITTALACVFHIFTQLFRLLNLRLADVFLLCMLEGINIRIQFRIMSTCDDIAAFGLFRRLEQLHRGYFLRLWGVIVSSLRRCSDGFSRRDDATFATGALARHPQKLLNLTVIDFDESGHVSVSSSFFASRWSGIRQLDLAHVNLSISKDVHWHQSLFDLDKFAIRGLGASWVSLFLAAF